ncbi:MAG: hypothetical protein EP329_00285 [Deltaproteobacteria bacterium]|nr:MAG: hypothetical protein EP329_00285 [Deltaproteobacteria bacterium]
MGSGAASSEAAEAVGLVDADVRIDPFSAREAFVRHVHGAAIRTWYDRCRVEPLEPIDTGVDKRIDLDAIVKKGGWQGSVKAPREKTREEYPLELEEQMREVERQFILRNIGRYELFVNPDEPMPFDHDRFDKPSIDAAMAEARDYQHEPPELLAALSLDAVREEIDWRRRFTREMRWNRRFGAEVQKHVQTPLWKFDPEDPEAAATVAAIEAEITGSGKDQGERG